MYHGTGTYTFPDGSTYKGQFCMNRYKMTLLKLWFHIVILFVVFVIYSDQKVWWQEIVNFHCLKFKIVLKYVCYSCVFPGWKVKEYSPTHKDWFGLENLRANQLWVWNCCTPIRENWHSLVCIFYIYYFTTQNTYLSVWVVKDQGKK